jgi:hypothetical protein
LNEKFLYKDKAFVKIEIEDPAECFLLEQMFAGIKLKKKDYKVLDACKNYVEKLIWDGVTEDFVKGIGSIINYVFLSSDVRVDTDTICQIVATIDEKQFNTTTELPENINEQFKEEMLNYELFEKVRRQIVVSES